MINTKKIPPQKKILQTKATFFSITETIDPAILKKITDEDKEIVKAFVAELEKIPESKWNNDTFKDMMVDLQKTLNVKPNIMFKPLYLILVGSERGPRLGPLMELIDRDWIINRLKKAIE